MVFLGDLIPSPSRVEGWRESAKIRLDGFAVFLARCTVKLAIFFFNWQYEQRLYVRLSSGAVFEVAAFLAFEEMICSNLNARNGYPL